jgi:MFS family permease
MRNAWIAFAIGSAFFLFEFVTRIEPSLDAQAIAGFYHLGNSGFGTLSSLFFWVYAPMQIVVGLLLDRFGARRFVLLGCFACAAGALAFAATGNVWLGGAARALTGFGASFAFVASLWLVNHWFAPQRFALLSGAVNAVGMLGAAIGAVLLSDVIAAAGWRAVFAATGAAGLLLLSLAFIFLREPASPAVTAQAPPVEHVRGALAAVLGNPRVWALSVVGLLYYMPVNVYGGLWGTSELVGSHHLSPVAAEIVVSMIFWGMALGSLAGGWLSDLLGHRKYLVFFGSLLTGIAYAAALYLPLPEYAEGALLFIAGFFGGFQMLTFTMAKEGLGKEITGTVVAFVNMVGIAGALIFQPLVGYLADRAGGNFDLALGSVPLCAFAAALVVLFIAEYRHPDHLPDAQAGGVPAQER